VDGHPVLTSLVFAAVWTACEHPLARHWPIPPLSSISTISILTINTLSHNILLKEMFCSKLCTHSLCTHSLQPLMICLYLLTNPIIATTLFLMSSWHYFKEYLTNTFFYTYSEQHSPMRYSLWNFHSKTFIRFCSHARNNTYTALSQKSLSKIQT